MGNAEANKLANEGRLKTPQDEKGIVDWIKENSWEVLNIKMALQQKIWAEKAEPIIQYNSKTCELCKRPLKTAKKKREHVEPEHKNYIDKYKNIYNCNVEKESSPGEETKPNDIPEVQGILNDDEEVQETLGDIVIKKKLTIPNNKFKKESVAHKLVTSILQDKDCAEWNKHVEGLKKLKDSMYNEIKEMSRVIHENAKKRYNEKTSKRRQEATEQNAGINDNSNNNNNGHMRDKNDYKTKLGELNFMIKTLRGKMDCEDSAQGHNILKKQL